MNKIILLDQCGYLPQMEKKVTFRTEAPMGFRVVTSDGRCVFQGTASERIETASAGETVYVGDFSAVTAPGRYYIIANAGYESDPFTIDSHIYEEVFQKAFSFFYLQRCGCDLPQSGARRYAHKACHTGLATVYGTREKREVTGGWHDAGDYGRYIVPAAVTVAQLLSACEDNPSLAALYRALPGSLPSDAAVSEDDAAFPMACLEEIRYELEWMLKLQREDGQVYHKATCYSFCSFIMPEEERDELVLSPVSVTATADFAAAMAMAVRFYCDKDPDFAGRLAQASRKAYDALRTMELPGGFKNPPDVRTGEYGDACDTDERYWAAAELYKAFGDACYREDFERLAAQKIYHGYGWEDVGSFGNRAYLTAGRPVDLSLKARIESSMIALADKRLLAAAADGYGTALLPGEYVWGSNMTVSNNGIHLYDAWRLTGDRKYLDAAAQQLHYLLGRNPVGLCYLTGCGTDSIRRPHHRPSVFWGKAMPGMLSGGPCGRRLDPAAKGLIPEEFPPAKAHADMYGSYSTNEVAIYWNSAFLQLLASVTAV